MAFKMCQFALLAWTLCLLASVSSARMSEVVKAAVVPKLHITYLGAIRQDFTQEQTVAHHESVLQTVFPSKAAIQQSTVYNYKKSFSGFAAMLTDHQAAVLRDHPDVASVFESGVQHVSTTYSWRYLGLDSGFAWPLANYGDGIIVGLLDTGIWPESQSFNDKDFGPIPAKWNGTCNFLPLHLCNKKLIGAKSLVSGAAAQGLMQQSEDDSPRDIVGHGTHTSSTAAGAFVANASMMGIAQGTAVGGAPKARVAMYKVCANQGCSEADILAGFDEAISDGVDVMSVSLGGGLLRPLYKDVVAIGAFHAVAANILVAAAAGNWGLLPSSVVNSAPWILTVAASSINRDFVAGVQLGDGYLIQGTSINTFDNSTSLPLIDGASAGYDSATNHLSSYCYEGSLDPEKVRGRVVMCQASWEGRTDQVVNTSGGVGLIFVSDHGCQIAYPFGIPTSCISAADSTIISSYIKSTRDPTVTILKTTPVLGLKPAPVVAGFSSRGPSYLTPEILKPDLTAPGVDILAAWSPVSPPTLFPGDNRAPTFNIISGTSMSTPHAAGAAAMIKAAHPEWSVAAIKSALMTTANSLDVQLDGNGDGVYAFGSGLINPNAAVDPGLVYDNTAEDNALFLCTIGFNSSSLSLVTGTQFSCPSGDALPPPWDLNYPSISLTSLNGPVDVTRTVTNVGLPDSIYTLALLQVPPQLDVQLYPQQLVFARQSQKLSFTVSIRPLVDIGTNYTGFGSFAWTDRYGHFVSSPIVVSSVP